MTEPTKPAPVCLIAGGATGIGAETARLMAGRGCRIAICDINRNDGEQVAADLGGHFFYTDVREDESVRQAVEGCAQQLGIPTYVSLNFGVMTAASDSPFQPLEAVSIEAYRRVMSVNVDGVFFGLRHLIPRCHFHWHFRRRPGVSTGRLI